MTRRITLIPALLVLAAAAALGLGGPRLFADEPVTFDKVPAAAQKTIQARLKGGEITEIERSQNGDKVVYEVEVKGKDGVFDILVAADGTFLGEEGQDEGAGEDDEGVAEDDKGAGEDDHAAGEEDEGAGKASARPDATTPVPTPLKDGVHFSPRITHPYFPLSTVRYAEFRSKGGETKICEVQDATRTVAGTECLVLAEKHYEDEELEEISHNFFAEDAEGSVYYFGEDVDMYKDGQIVGHGGAWLVGKNATEPCLFMPARLKVGLDFKRENSPPDAEEWDEVADLHATLRVPAGRFKDVLMVQEGDTLNKWIEQKYYARGVGLISENRTLNLIEMPEGAASADDEGEDEDDDDQRGEDEDDEGGEDEGEEDDDKQAKPPQRLSP